MVGSSGYSNYRHQSDGCHAYHVVRRHGIPAENVVLMMFDDVAWHERNPYPGSLYNRPANSSAEAIDVYKGCHIDYTGVEVTPETFINVMIGNSTGAFGKKVLNSTDQDRVFVNFVDHGSRGNVYFPHMKPLTAARLKDTMRKMHDKKMYKELVFYMEACESGSMFSSHFLKSINAYVTTAANGFESSWATYCPPLDEVNGERIGSCLGDLYSVNWMEDSDLTDLSDESLSKQFLRVKNETSKSHVKYFGSSTVSKEIVGNFQSTYDKKNDDDASTSNSANQEDTQEAVPHSTSVIDSAVDARDVDLVVSFYRYLRAAPGKDRRQLADELTATIRSRETADEIFEAMATLYQQQVNAPLQQVEHPEDFACHEEATRVFESACRFAGASSEGFTSYSLKYAGTLMDLCESELTQEAVVGIVRTACSIVESRHAAFNKNVAMWG